MQFPYSNIPIHNRRILLKKYNVVNQLFDYNFIYQIIRDTKEGAFTMYCKVLKDSDSAIVVQGLELNSIFDMTIDELKHFNICNTPNPTIRKRLNNGFSKVEIKNQRQQIDR